MSHKPQAENAEPLPEAVAEMLSLSGRGSADALEAAWMVAVEEGSIASEHLVLVLDDVASRQRPKLMESLLWLLISINHEKRGADAALDAVWQARNLLPDSDSLREEITGLYRKVHVAAAGIETLTQMTLLRKDVPLKSAILLLERLLELRPGTYVSDSRRKSPGRITGPDAARKVLTVSFGESERAYDALGLDALEVLEANDFRAMAIFDHPGLETLAKDDPAQLVQLVLKTNGPRMGIKDLKARLVGTAVSATGWSKWWSGAKAVIKRCPVIEVSEGTQPEFFLRARPVTYEEEARGRLAEAPTPEDKIIVMLGYLNETGHDAASEEALLKSFAADLVRMADPAAGLPPVTVLEAWAALAEVRHRTGYADLPPLPADLGARLSGEANLAAIVASIGNDALAHLVLTLVRENVPEGWPAVFAAAMPACTQEICDRIASDLAAGERSDLIATTAAAVLRQPNQSVPALIWLWKSACLGKYAEALGELNRASVTIRLFQAINEVALTPTQDKPRQQDLLWQGRRAVGAKDFGLLKDVLDNTDANWAREIRTTVSRNAGLTDHLRVQVLEVLGKAHPQPVAKTLPPWEEDAVYTTPGALEIRRKQYEELTTVKMIEIANRIGVALGHGDISENSEFTSALEERDRMTERANSMQTDLTKARVINRSMAAGDFVNIGTTVVARRLSSGQDETLTFLGPWDANVEKGIYYYKAPLAMAFMGKRVGETVSYGVDAAREQWEVLEIRPAI
jgi:transcription elongation factor GreA